MKKIVNLIKRIKTAAREGVFTKACNKARAYEVCGGTQRRRYRSILLVVLCFTLPFAFAGCNFDSGGADSTREPAASDTVLDAGAGYAGERISDGRSIPDTLYTVYNTVGGDDFGRFIQSVDTSRGDKERYVGIFYFSSLGQHTGMTGIYDVSKLIAGGKSEEFDKDSPVSPVNKAHIWGEPVWGYYDSRDEWVIRRQIELLTFAGFDYICADGTNGPMYFPVVDKVLDILLEYKNKGWNVPGFSYYLGGSDVEANDIDQLTQVYNRYYASGKYDDVMFKLNGRPMAVIREHTEVTMKAAAAGVQKTLAGYFTFKHRQWPIGDSFQANGLPWIDFNYPQKLHTDTMNVSTAQHVSVRFSDTEGSRGRGWNYVTGKNERENFKKEINYENQWKTVLENDAVSNVFVTGWNEWTATKQNLGVNSYPEHNGFLMCDTFNDEFSRDIEPTKTSGMKDTAYLLTIRNLRDFKYNAAKHYSYPELTFSMDDFDETLWAGASKFRDFTGEAVTRDYSGLDGKAYYYDESNRNDIDTVYAARDSENLYFRVSAFRDITPYEAGDLKWMNIWLNTRGQKQKGAMGYSFVINRNLISENKSEIRKAAGANSFVKCGEADIAVGGKVLLVKIPLKALGLNATNYDIEFKVTDNTGITDVLQFYNTGDAAPVGTLSYKFGY
jgi:hypothetical protein